MPQATRSASRKDYRSKPLLNWVEDRMAPDFIDFPDVLERSRAGGLREIQIGPAEGLILRTLAAASGGHRAVEIGTLGGYSAHWILSGLRNKGVLYTFEADEKAAAIAREGFEASGNARRVRLFEGLALEKLPTIEPMGPFDFVFIDADKPNYPNYLKWAAKNLRPGGMVALDNAFAFGKLHLEPEKAGEDAERVKALRDSIDLLTDPADFAGWCMVPTGEGLAVGTKAAN